MKQAPLDLVKSEDRYREVLEQAAEGISVTDQQLNFLLVNQALCNMVGYTREELLKMKTTDLIESASLEQLPLQTKTILSGETVRVERSIRRKDGSIILVEGSNKLLADGTIQTILHDITERKRAEEKLKQTEAFYRAITEKSNEGVMVLDKNLVVLYRKPPQFPSGYSNEELVGFNRTDLIHPDDVAQFMRELAKLKSEQTLTFIFRIKNPAGDWDYFESLTTNLLDNPHIQGYVVNYRNVNERKRAEEKLQQTEAFYRAVTEQSHEGITVIDRFGKVRYRSAVNAATTGYEDDQLTQENFARFTHPDDQQRITETIRRLAPNESRLVESRLKTARGEWRWLESSITNLLEHPAIQGYVINTRDISERKAAEEKLNRAEAFYRAVTEQSNEGVMVFDKDMIIHYRNPSQLHISSFPYDEMVGRDRTDTIHPDDLREFLLELPHLQPGQTLLNTFRAQDGEGKWNWFESRVTNLLEHPAVHGYVSNYYNINERKEAEAVQRELSQQLLNVQEEERRAIARELHDEIGQSLTAIKVGLQTAKHLGTPETLDDALRLTETVLSQVRELSLNLHPRLLEDLGLTAALRWYASEQAKRGGLELSCDIRLDNVTLAPDLNITIYRIVQEALTNILRHAQAKSVLLSLVTQHGSLTLRVKDDGRGIAPTLLTNPLTKESIGLVSMRERAKLQGGRLELHAAPGQGTEVVATFPLRGD